MKPAFSLRSIGVVCLVAGAAGLAPDLSYGQVMGPEAELERLRAKAEDAIGNDDPDAAALNMGRAALLAKQLGKGARDDAALARFYEGAEPLFRAQEHGYRAMALFRRAGGQVPASSGVCGSLALAQASILQARSLLDAGGDNAAGEPGSQRVAQLRAAVEDWDTTVAAMIADYQCP
jgi:hypothetical protein